jgi:transcriptional regulator with XRE-family HTH domain
VAGGNELGEFLRARRERLTPEEVGLPVLGRRRTPGLRREEVATLAGVSIDYLVRLEQGRDTNPSAAVIAALADVLRLSQEERTHLGLMVARTNNGELCPAAETLSNEVRPTVVTLLEQLDPTPAFVLGPLNDILAWNDAWARLVAPTGVLEDEAPNLARYVFLHDEAKRLFRDWEWAADEQVGRLRWAQARWGNEPQFASLLDALRTVPEFAARWEAHEVAEKRRGVTRLMHPDAGELRIAYEVLTLPDEDQRLVTWLPYDDAAAAALRVALSTGEAVSPARLRVVGPA